MDASLHGGTRGNGPELHFGFGKRQEGNLYSQSGTARYRVRHEHLKTRLDPGLRDAYKVLQETH